MKKSQRHTSILVLCLLTLWILLAQGIKYLFDPIPEWLFLTQELVMYFIVAVLIWLERKHLDEFNIGKITLLLYIVFGCILRIGTLTSVTAILFYPFFLGLGVTISVAFQKKALKLPNILPIEFFWLFFGIFVGIILSIMLAYPTLVFVDTNSIPKIKNVPAAFIAMLIASGSELAHAAIPEELIFRGFLWGYMNRLGWRQHFIWLVQATMFWLAHVNSLDKAYSFWVVIPIMGLVFGYLRWATRKLDVCISCHAIYNSMGNIVNRLIVTFLS